MTGNNQSISDLASDLIVGETQPQQGPELVSDADKTADGHDVNTGDFDEADEVDEVDEADEADEVDQPEEVDEADEVEEKDEVDETDEEDDDLPYLKDLEDDTEQPEEGTATARIQTLEQENKDLEQRLNSVLALFAGQEVAEPDASLIDPASDNYDPTEYNRQLAAAQKQAGEIQKAQQEFEQRQATLVKDYITNRDAVLKEQLPILFDPEKGPPAVKAISDEAVRRGLVREDQRALIPAGMAVTIHESLLYRAAVKRGKGFTKPQPKKAKVAAPAVIKKTPAGKKAGADALSQFARTQDTKDAVAHLLETPKTRRRR